MERVKHLREGVRRAYSEAAERPLDEHPFPVGRRFAESLGYTPDVLASIPSLAVDAFTGVSPVSVFAHLPPGVRVLDLGCGAGLDALIASRCVGSAGTVIGIDFSEAMLNRARRAAAEIGVDNVEFVRADAESLPGEDGSFDVALVNGIFNLNPVRDAIFRELARVVQPGGSVYAAELILCEPLPRKIRVSELEWFA